MCSTAGLNVLEWQIMRLGLFYWKKSNEDQEYEGK